MTKKNKTLSIRVTEEFYNNLKKVAKARNSNMTQLLINYSQDEIEAQAGVITLADSGRRAYTAKPKTTSQYLDQFVFTGKTYHDDKTYDEIAYELAKK